MRVEVTSEFKFARDGIHVVDVAVGAIVEGRCAEVALLLGKGHELAPDTSPLASVPVAEKVVVVLPPPPVPELAPPAIAPVTPAAVEAPKPKKQKR